MYYVYSIHINYICSKRFKTSFEHVASFAKPLFLFWRTTQHPIGNSFSLVRWLGFGVQQEGGVMGSNLVQLISVRIQDVQGFSRRRSFYQLSDVG